MEAAPILNTLPKTYSFTIDKAGHDFWLMACLKANYLFSFDSTSDEVTVSLANIPARRDPESLDFFLAFLPTFKQDVDAVDPLTPVRYFTSVYFGLKMLYLDKDNVFYTLKSRVYFSFLKLQYPEILAIRKDFQWEYFNPVQLYFLKLILPNIKEVRIDDFNNPDIVKFFETYELPQLETLQIYPDPTNSGLDMTTFYKPLMEKGVKTIAFDCIDLKFTHRNYKVFRNKGWISFLAKENIQFTRLAVYNAEDLLTKTALFSLDDYLLIYLKGIKKKEWLITELLYRSTLDLFRMSHERVIISNRCWITSDFTILYDGYLDESIPVTIRRMRQANFNVEKAQRELEILTEHLGNDHPNIVKAIDFILQPADIASTLIFERFEGMTLKRFLAKLLLRRNDSDTVPMCHEKRIQKIFRGILTGLVHIHSNDIIHCDIRPSKILIDKEDNVKITGFDLSCEASEAEDWLKVYQYYGNVDYSCEPDDRNRTLNDKTDMWKVGMIAFTFATACNHYIYRVAHSETLLVLQDELKYYQISPEFKSFIENLLDEDHKKRMTAKEALEHPFMKLDFSHVSNDELKLKENIYNGFLEIEPQRHKEYFQKYNQETGVRKLYCSSYINLAPWSYITQYYDKLPQRVILYSFESERYDRIVHLCRKYGREVRDFICTTYMWNLLPTFHFPNLTHLKLIIDDNRPVNLTEFLKLNGSKLNRIFIGKDKRYHYTDYLNCFSGQLIFYDNPYIPSITEIMIQGCAPYIINQSLFSYADFLFLRKKLNDKVKPWKIMCMGGADKFFQPIRSDSDTFWPLSTKLGRGVSCSVEMAYRIVDLKAGIIEKAAAKIFNGGFSDRSVYENELKFFGMINEHQHPNIVKFIQANRDYFNRLEFNRFIMEYIEGKTLSAYVDDYSKVNAPYKREKDPEIPIHFIQAITKGILNGLAFLHSKSIIHMDIKMNNIMINTDGIVKIIDFTHSTRITIPEIGRVWPQCKGNSQFASPESFEGAVNTTYDVWSLGIVLFQIVTGRTLTGRFLGDPLPDYLIEKVEEWENDLTWQEKDKLDSQGLQIYPRAFLVALFKNDISEIYEYNIDDKLKDFIAACLTKDMMERPTSAQLLEHPFIKENYSGNK